jgi:hypothetical protein
MMNNITFGEITWTHGGKDWQLVSARPHVSAAGPHDEKRSSWTLTVTVSPAPLAAAVQHITDQIIYSLNMGQA